MTAKRMQRTRTIQQHQQKRDEVNCEHSTGNKDTTNQNKMEVKTRNKVK